MLWTIAELKEMDEFKNTDDDVLSRKMTAIEAAIRGYTNNKFQNTKIRFKCKSGNDVLYGYHKLFKVGDTAEISQSTSNNGLYVVTEISKTEKTTMLDSSVCDNDYNLVTKIEYPKDILEGALAMLDWSINNADKIGVASESLSRHSVTYFNMDKSNTVCGFPVSLMGFCTPYMKSKTS